LSNTLKNGSTEVQLRKAQQAREGEQAWAQYEAERLALRQRTERLRALRLARDAALAATAVAKAPAKSSSGVRASRPRKGSVG